MSRATIPNTINTLPGGSYAASLLDANWTALLGPINDSSYGWVNVLTDTGSANAYAVANPAGQTFGAYRAGAFVAFIPANSNTGASTVNVDGLGNVAINNAGNQALTIGAIEAGRLCVLVHDGTRFRIANRCPSVIYNATATGTVTYNVTGATEVMVRVGITGNLTLVLNGLGIGVPIQIMTSNTSGSTWQMTLTGTDPMGNAYGMFYKSSGQASTVTFTNVNFSTGTTDLFMGITSNNGVGALSPQLIAIHV
jgi:hypothetical protein